MDSPMARYFPGKSIKDLESRRNGHGHVAAAAVIEYMGDVKNSRDKIKQWKDKTDGFKVVDTEEDRDKEGVAAYHGRGNALYLTELGLGLALGLLIPLDRLRLCATVDIVNELSKAETPSETKKRPVPEDTDVQPPPAKKPRIDIQPLSVQSVPRPPTTPPTSSVPMAVPATPAFAREFPSDQLYTKIQYSERTPEEAARIKEAHANFWDADPPEAPVADT